MGQYESRVGELNGPAEDEEDRFELQFTPALLRTLQYGSEEDPNGTQAQLQHAYEKGVYDMRHAVEEREKEMAKQRVRHDLAKVANQQREQVRLINEKVSEVKSRTNNLVSTGRGESDGYTFDCDAYRDACLKCFKNANSASECANVVQEFEACSKGKRVAK